MIEAIEEILNDIETIVGVIEVAINSSEVLANWEDEDYYGAGYSLGSGGLGLFILIEEVFEKYEELTDSSAWLL